MISVGLRAVSALAVGKWIAVFFGPAGTALFGQLMNLYTLFALMPNDGLARGIIREGSYLDGEGKDKEVAGVVGTGLMLMAGLFLLETILVLIIARLTDWLEPFQSSGMVPMLLLGFILLAPSYFMTNLFLVWKKTRYQARASGSLSLGGLAGLLAGWCTDQTIGASLAGFLVGQAAGGVLVVWMYRNHIPFRLRQFRFETSRVKPLLLFMLAVASSGLLNQIGIYGLVHWALETMEKGQVGLWMAMGRFADAFNTPILAVANSILMPMLAGKSGDSGALRSIVRPIFRRSLLALGLGMGILFWVYPFVLPVLYSKAFQAETPWVAWQLTGDFFKSSSYVISVLILAQGHTRFYFVLETASVAVLLVASGLLVDRLGYTGLFVAHAIRYGLYWLAIILRYRRLFF